MYRTKDQIAQEFIAEGRRQGITPRGIIMCIACGLVESNLIVYANQAVPESMKLPHDAVGSDSKSVGPLQQQVVWGNGWWWGDAATCMDPTSSSRLFYERLKKLDYNNTRRSAGSYVQEIQRSAYPDRYDQRMAEATAIYNRLSGAVAPPKEEEAMGWKGDPVWLADVLRAEGVAVEEFPGWRERGHGDFLEITHVMAHHMGAPGTAGPGSIAFGHAGLEGPLSQVYLGRNGVAVVVALGVAWHAGVGRYPGLPDNNANWHSIGIEAENSGTEGWSAAQYWAYVKVCAAICRRLGYGADRVIGHKEWAAVQGKWDPGGIDMNAFRRDIQNQINAGPRPAPVIPPNQIDEMQRIIEKSTNWLGARVGKMGEERVCGKDGKGRFAQFANGYIYWHPNTGARAVPNRIFQYWAGTGWENGPCGYPTRNHTYVEGKGDIQAFEHNLVVFRRLTDDDPGQRVGGVIGDAYFKLGAESSWLGWPESEEYDYEGGRAQDFQGGTLAWHPSGAVVLSKKEVQP